VHVNEEVLQIVGGFGRGGDPGDHDGKFPKPRVRELGRFRTEAHGRPNSCPGRLACLQDHSLAAPTACGHLSRMPPVELSEEIIAEATARSEKAACRPGDHPCYPFAHRLVDSPHLHAEGVL